MKNKRQEFSSIEGHQSPSKFSIEGQMSCFDVGWHQSFTSQSARALTLPSQTYFQKKMTAKAQLFPSPRSTTQQRCFFSSMKTALITRNELQPAYTFLCKQSSRRRRGRKRGRIQLTATSITASITSATAASRQSTRNWRPSSHPAKR